jgi:hypothetical protein
MPQLPPKPKNKQKFYTMDIHLHTRASADFQTPEATNLDILQKAESRGLDIISFTDHNTIRGYANLLSEIEQLTTFEKSNRLLAEEKIRLQEYKRLLEKILILPGFEFTAMLGFHIIALFSPKKSLREIEHLLIDLGVPPNQLDLGSTTIGATVDVIRAYQLINQAGGIVIAAHANSSNGVAMRGMNFGGQTRIAYTQDQNLHALEVTDLDIRGPRAAASFFNGTKPEYPRRMHCIQGSDAHRLSTDPVRKKNYGVGDRATDVLLTELSFEALKELFLSNDFSRTRPHTTIKEESPFDYIQTALDEGANIVQSFHETVSNKPARLNPILADICAFLNTNGGTVFIGLPANSRVAPLGITTPAQVVNTLHKEIETRISPPIKVAIDIQKYKNKDIIRVLVPRGDEPPYALDENQIFIRDESETNLAVRDEIVTLIVRHMQSSVPVSESNHAKAPIEVVHVKENGITDALATTTDPRTGVEITSSVERGGKTYYSMRDLRNGNIVKNVTQASARRLWHYAISKYGEISKDIGATDILWKGNYGLVRQYLQGQNQHYDFVLNTGNGYRYFFGVTTDGINGDWKTFLSTDDE